MVKFALLRYLRRVSTQSFVVLIIGNSKSNHLGAQGIFNLTTMFPVSCAAAFASALSSTPEGARGLHEQSELTYNAYSIAAWHLGLTFPILCFLVQPWRLVQRARAPYIYLNCLLSSCMAPWTYVPYFVFSCVAASDLSSTPEGARAAATAAAEAATAAARAEALSRFEALTPDEAAVRMTKYIYYLFWL